MKLSNLILASTFASSVALTGIQGVANAADNDGAKTVWGETLPTSADPDGDGWANVDFDPSVLPQEYQEQIANLNQQKDNNVLSQVEYNEQVAKVYNQAVQEQRKHQTTQGERPFGGITPDGMTNEEYAQLEQNVPNPNDVSTEEYNRAVNEETAKLQTEHQNGNHNKSNELPATGKLNNTVLNLSIGTLLAFVGGLAILISRKYNFEK
ncbi:LPXTG cell wall anchor domain-containing protein [Staphylococcus gallinarum]|uniref:LPXTG cell wall anchor domain-containing protein n=1 Tax=Staphylococcus gallinarum TaxID=1293 RepID=UPI000D1E8684|nr:LPXTG cell wall anchor domain-containing protein [Staphylococcus gallinarum]MCD8787277.1 LPXTG cell wall anchor domain-containing protein [Staphylococcus gallinarum]MCD8859671.1 LPXTG cell wall anchor domain-containing protein [Staphylococcus gallinarum]PTL16826.1 peptidase [Staphylococcus gallinarum]RIO80467.1 peptidase [Staphylococcus gallinarum]